MYIKVSVNLIDQFDQTILLIFSQLCIETNLVLFSSSYVMHLMIFYPVLLLLTTNKFRDTMTGKAPRPGPCLDFGSQYALKRNNHSKNLGQNTGPCLAPIRCGAPWSNCNFTIFQIDSEVSTDIMVNFLVKSQEGILNQVIERFFSLSKINFKCNLILGLKSFDLQNFSVYFLIMLIWISQ